MKTIGARIRYVRNQKGLTLEQLATKAKISKSFLWEVEQSRSDITGEKLLRVANVLGASLEFLLRGEPIPENYRPTVVELPAELDEFAKKRRLSYRQTRTLLEIGLAVRSFRRSGSGARMGEGDWEELYEGLKSFLEEKR